MSTTAHTIDEVQGRDEPDRVFRRYVFNNPSICSCCFRRLKANESHVRAYSGITGHDLEPKATRAVSVRAHKTGPGEIGPEGPLEGTRQVDNTAIAKYPVRTVCEDCGSIAGRADSDPLSRRKALARAETLADRLAEVGEPVQLNLLKHLVGYLKSQEDLSSYDTECFEAATTIAVREARGRR
ncbi:hypothetical protein NP511_01995 [Natrinema thermotolerans]|uniref:Uncharacterized protein n=1 Tax=Natrinema thermotolerans TaxID=121872 RepID=A0AAF0PDA8_9EURY|nr:hypothetical protein [Natrinema thermotolerans]WPH65833.1 hypothetical protein HJTV4_gp9 [Haloarchaeal virus HJTV-4]QCC60738.1 hypothetical protein DVR14_19690 [Natrinema thermotolerans]QCC61616.1 hypothetical protein DVR14_23820 [Natrinema thermotolerans]WMT07782.1 hypothetical protein NP511_20710 [Natrinema thermotolerans]WMT08414.1 hypothetical protein NP511_01995 [Natrinema thermotolerans]